MELQLKVKLLRDGALLPTRGTPGSAGLDLYYCPSQNLAELPCIPLDPGSRAGLTTGIAVEIPPGYVGQVVPRSGLAARHGISVLNSPGIIDSDYRGEVVVILHNPGAAAYAVQPGDRIAQLLVLPVPNVEVVQVEELSPTERGAGGMGSTGR